MPMTFTSPTRLTGKAWAILLLYAGSLFFLFLGSYRSFSHHESFVVQPAREMLQNGDWLIPRVAGQPWIEKPPLAHWCVAALGLVFGEVTETVARLPSAIAGLVGVLIVAALAARWFGTTVGLLAGLVQATTVYTLTYARLAECDISLWALVLGCLSIFARHHTLPDHVPRWYESRFMFFLLLGLDTAAERTFFRGCDRAVAVRDLPCMAARLEGTALVLLLARTRGISVLSLAWPIAVAAIHPQAVDLWWLHTIGRFDGSMTLNTEPAWYYFTTWPWQFLPWTLLLFAGLPASIRRAGWQRSESDRFLVTWVLAPFAVLTMIQAKHHHYLIYGAPPPVDLGGGGTDSCSGAGDPPRDTAGLAVDDRLDVHERPGSGGLVGVSS